MLSNLHLRFIEESKHHQINKKDLANNRSPIRTTDFLINNQEQTRNYPRHKTTFNPRDERMRDDLGKYAQKLILDDIVELKKTHKRAKH